MTHPLDLHASPLDFGSVPIRDAASVLLLRGNPTQDTDPNTIRVLMGQRGEKAAFMPRKFVFPGGAVDPEDSFQSAGFQHNVSLSERCLKRLQAQAETGSPDAYYNAAVRELREETSLELHAGAPLRFVFRAITPAGNSRRFDARFFVAWAADATGDLDDFSRAEDELSSLQWVTLSDAFSLDLPNITRRVLAHVQSVLTSNDWSQAVPFFDPAKPSDAAGKLD